MKVPVPVPVRLRPTKQSAPQPPPRQCRIGGRLQADRLHGHRRCQSIAPPGHGLCEAGV